MQTAAQTLRWVSRICIQKYFASQIFMEVAWPYNEEVQKQRTGWAGMVWDDKILLPHAVLRSNRKVMLVIHIFLPSIPSCLFHRRMHSITVLNTISNSLRYRSLRERSSLKGRWHRASSSISPVHSRDSLPWRGNKTYNRIFISRPDKKNECPQQKEKLFKFYSVRK